MRLRVYIEIIYNLKITTYLHFILAFIRSRANFRLDIEELNSESKE